MTIKKIWGSRVQADGATFIADDGLIFYDENDGELRIGDGVTPGGLPISVRADLITAQSLLPELDNVEDYDLGSPSRRWHHLYIGDGGVKFNGDTYPNPQTVPYIPGAQVNDIVPATDNGVDLGDPTHRFGNVYLGYQGLYLADTITDQNINIVATDGTLYLNGVQNLRVGNLTIIDTTLTSATNNLDISIGDAGDTGFFYVKRKAQFDNTTFSSTQAMVGMNASGVAEPATIFPDTVLQTTGRPNKNSRIVQRSYGSTGEVGGDNAYSVWASYSARGNVATPAAIKQNDILSRLSSNGYGTTTWGAGGTRIESVALENFTDSAKGSKINFWTTPVGSIVPQIVASVNSVGLVTSGVEFSDDGTIQTSNAIPFSQKAIAGAAYVATLGVDGKLDATQIPTSLSGAVVFKGGWNANTNTPELSDSLPAGVQPGWEYVVTVTGTRDIGDGTESFVAGDFVIYDGANWTRIAAANNLTYATASSISHLKINGNVGTQETGVLTFTTDATPNTGSGTIVSRDSNGNFQANIITAALAGQATSALTAATVTAGSQTAITAVGTLTSLAVTGNVTAGNVTSSTGTITAATGQFTNINNSIATLQTQVYANANVAAYLLTNTGNITAGNISDSVGLLRSIPQNSKNTGYTLQSTDNGQMINITTGNVTIPAGVFNSPFGQTVSIFNNQTTSNAVVQGSGVTLRLAGTTATGNRTLARYGVATLICVAANTFVISGAGLT